MSNTPQTDVIIVGAGNRGTEYGRYILKSPTARVVGVAEPREFYRNRVVDMHGIAPENVYTDWRQLAERDKFADAVVIATQDGDHTAPAIAFANKGYHMLLEKPMAPTPEECKRIYDAATKNDILFGVCHVMRYTQYTQRLKSLIDSGLIGEVVCLQHLEPVGYWHQAHSFVRGNWRNEAESTPMLLAKSCHDLDWISYVMDAPCRRVSSFGSLFHFRKDNQPAGAADRCVDCSVESACPYSAVKIYLGRVRQGHLSWPVNTIVPEVSEESVTEAITTGPYGRCVYDCDNDVVDNQVVNMEFEGGRTANFVMTAFNEQSGRKTRIFGTRGELYGDGNTIEHYDFLTDEKKTVDLDSVDSTIDGGHGGGDGGLIRAWLGALAKGDQSLILSGPNETLESHMMVFAAEQARKQGTVVEVKH